MSQRSTQTLNRQLDEIGKWPRLLCTIMNNAPNMSSIPSNNMGGGYGIQQPRHDMEYLCAGEQSD